MPLTADPALESIIQDENLNPAETYRFVARALRDGALSPNGVAITKILPPVSRFTPDGRYGAMKRRVVARLTAFVLQRFAAPAG